MTVFVATSIGVFYSRGRTWEMARSVIYLFCKLEGLSPIPSTHITTLRSPALSSTESEM